jgi:hypothetical protein
MGNCKKPQCYNNGKIEGLWITWNVFGIKIITWYNNGSTEFEKEFVDGKKKMEPGLLGKRMVQYTINKFGKMTSCFGVMVLEEDYITATMYK